MVLPLDPAPCCASCSGTRRRAEGKRDTALFGSFRALRGAMVLVQQAAEALMQHGWPQLPSADDLATAERNLPCFERPSWRRRWLANMCRHAPLYTSSTTRRLQTRRSPLGAGFSSA